MTNLKEALEQRKDLIIQRLIKLGYTKMDDGRQLYELTLADLKQLHTEMISERGEVGKDENTSSHL